jgi:hypothetical protein
MTFLGATYDNRLRDMLRDAITEEVHEEHCSRRPRTSLRG